SEGGSLGFFRGRMQLGGGFQSDRISYSVGIAHLNVSNGVDGDDAARNTSGQGSVRFQLSPNTMLSARIYATDAFQQVNASPEAIGPLPPTGIIKAVPLSSVELQHYQDGTPVSQLALGMANFIPSANDPDFRRVARFVSSVVTLSQ